MSIQSTSVELHYQYHLETNSLQIELSYFNSFYVAWFMIDGYPHRINKSAWFVQNALVNIDMVSPKQLDASIPSKQPFFVKFV